MRCILGNVDHRSKLALEMTVKDHMLLNAFSALFPSQHGDFSEKHFSSSTFTTLMNNASDAAENSFILTMCLKIMANRVFHKKKKRKSHGLLNFD